MNEGELWHLVEGKRDDGLPSIFRIRELEPRLDQSRIFVVEVFYNTLGEARLPDAAAYRRLAQFEEQWLLPACNALDYSFVATRIENGSAFLYLYGSGDPMAMIEKLSPFDTLGFFDEDDPKWDEYAALRELLAEAKAFPTPRLQDESGETPRTKKPTTKPKTTKRKRASTKSER